MANATNMTGKDNAPTVLIVEDDPFIAIDLEDAFLDAGFNVIGPCATAQHAVDIARTSTPDLATLDYHLADTDSSSVARALDRLDIPYLMVTSAIAHARNNAAIQPAYYLKKPFECEQLVEHSRELLAA